MGAYASAVHALWRASLSLLGEQPSTWHRQGQQREQQQCPAAAAVGRGGKTAAASVGGCQTTSRKAARLPGRGSRAVGGREGLGPSCQRRSGSAPQRARRGGRARGFHCRNSSAPQRNCISSLCRRSFSCRGGSELCEIFHGSARSAARAPTGGERTSIAEHSRAGGRAASPLQTCYFCGSDNGSANFRCCSFAKCSFSKRAQADWLDITSKGSCVCCSWSLFHEPPEAVASLPRRAAGKPRRRNMVARGRRHERRDCRVADSGQAGRWRTLQICPGRSCSKNGHTCWYYKCRQRYRELPVHCSARCASPKRPGFVYRRGAHHCQSRRSKRSRQQLPYVHQCCKHQSSRTNFASITLHPRSSTATSCAIRCTEQLFNTDHDKQTSCATVSGNGHIMLQWQELIPAAAVRAFAARQRPRCYSDLGLEQRLLSGNSEEPPGKRPTRRSSDQGFACLPGAGSRHRKHRARALQRGQVARPARRSQELARRGSGAHATEHLGTHRISGRPAEQLGHGLQRGV